MSKPSFWDLIWNAYDALFANPVEIEVNGTHYHTTGVLHRSPVLVNSFRGQEIIAEQPTLYLRGQVFDGVVAPGSMVTICDQEYRVKNVSFDVSKNTLRCELADVA